MRGGRRYDFIYIDADHSEDAVYADLCAALITLTPGGVIGGHDYSPMFPGVEVAVTRFCHKYGWRLAMLTRDGSPSFLLTP